MPPVSSQPSASDVPPPSRSGGDPELTPPITVIENQKKWRLVDLRELHAYRDLLRFLVWRNIRVRYAQSVIGVGWAIVQPVVSMVLFTIIFGRLAKLSSDGAPYALFSFTALVPWTYFSNAVTDGVNSLVTNANMLRKVYFPRVLLPFASIVAKLLDFAIALVMLFLLMLAYGTQPNWWGLLLLPALVVLMVVAAAGVSMWLTALAVQYRDVKHALGFAIQLLMYATPVVFATSLIPETYPLGGFEIYPRLLFALNPMVGVIEGFRSVLLGTSAVPWSLVLVSTVSALTLFVSGMLFFRAKEAIFADVA